MTKRTVVWMLSLVFVGCGGGARMTALERARVGAGGWDAVRVIAGRGTIDAGGMSGTFTSVEDVRTGRNRSDVDLGNMHFASGDDGAGSWELTANGEVVVADAPESIAEARTAAWLTRRGYLSDAGATYLKRDGAVLATPDGGTPVELWFDEATGLLTKTVVTQGRDTVTTRYEDYRAVEGVQLPFKIVIDDGDPRSLVTIVYQEQTLEDAVDEMAFARPGGDDGKLTFVGGATESEVAFDLVNNHIYIDATVNGTPVRMLVDTGGLNLLTPQAAEKLGLEVSGKLVAGGAGAGKVDVGLAQGKELAVGDVRLADPMFYVLDLGSLDGIEGVPFDGLVGFEMFARLAVRIDYPAGKLRMIAPKAFAAPAGAIGVPFDLRDRTPVVTGEVDGVAARFTIDTGARNSLTLHAPFVKDHELVAHYQPKFETVVGWGVGGEVRGWPVRFGEIHLGDAVVTEVAGDLFTGTEGSAADPDFDGNLGGGVLRRFVVTFDYAGRTMYLEPAANPPPRDIYDRAGMFYRLDGDAIGVLAVTAGGPAEKAGLAVDDRIVSIDGQAIGTHSLPEWRGILSLGKVGDKHKLQVERLKKPVTLQLAEQLP